uniref:Uncharacterized protein n=1 Tax=Anguilla anguilla TaxID=7936 RepID=A0A0E9UVN0_ANGAN
MQWCPRFESLLITRGRMKTSSTAGLKGQISVSLLYTNCSS